MKTNYLIYVVILLTGIACKARRNCSSIRVASQSQQLVAEEPNMAPSFSGDALVERAKLREYWPGIGEDWRKIPKEEEDANMTTTECAKFAKRVFPPAGTDVQTALLKGVAVDKLEDKDEALRSDGVLVVQGGKIVYENYVGPYKDHPEKLHAMWSASKSFTTGIAAAIAELSQRTQNDETVPGGKLLKDGKVFGLETTLSELMQTAELNSDPRFAQLTVGQLLDMSVNLHWLETYEAGVKTSNIVKMLWHLGYGNMSKYAGSQPFSPEGVGQKFDYSSGNAVILMRALKELYGEEYYDMPWTVLFDRIGMKKVTFERDQQGIFVGSSYLHTTLRDMAKFGYLYLNGGWYNHEQILHPDFFRKARVLSPSMVATGTTEEAIVEEGAYYSSGFWINPDSNDLKGPRKFAKQDKFFPNSPNDVIFAAGHYGQLILIFPQEDLMVVRMGHDDEYFSKLDDVMSMARSCFIKN